MLSEIYTFEITMEQKELPTCCLDGYYVSVVSADDVAHIVCCHANNDETFFVTMEENTGVCVRLSLHNLLDLPTFLQLKPSWISMSMYQFWLFINHACTGHKLQ